MVRGNYSEQKMSWALGLTRLFTSVDMFEIYKEKTKVMECGCKKYCNSAQNRRQMQLNLQRSFSYRSKLSPEAKR